MKLICWLYGHQRPSIKERSRGCLRCGERNQSQRRAWDRLVNKKAERRAHILWLVRGKPEVKASQPYNGLGQDLTPRWYQQLVVPSVFGMLQ